MREWRKPRVWRQLNRIVENSFILSFPWPWSSTSSYITSTRCGSIFMSATQRPMSKNWSLKEISEIIFRQNRSYLLFLITVLSLCNLFKERQTYLVIPVLSLSRYSIARFMSRAPNRIWWKLLNISKVIPLRFVLNSSWTFWSYFW